MSASEQNYANGRQTATISVGNEGVKDASGFTVDVYEDDDWIDTADVIVFQRTIKDVTNADSVVVPFELDRSKMNVTPGKDKLYIVKVTTEDEVCTGDNQYLLLLPTLESEITGVQICDGRANLTYDYDTNKNKSYQLTATTTLTGVKANVNWSSSNNAVATIDASSGNLTIKGTGTAIITTKADDSAKATVTVTVKSVDKTAPKNVKVNSVKVDSVTLSWNTLTAVSNKGKFTKVSTVKNAKKTTFLDKKVSSKKRIIIRYAHIKL